MTGGVTAALEQRIARGDLERDPAQAALAAEFDALIETLGHRGRGGFGLARLFGARKAEPVRGIYVVGAVGRGKTMLMDLFFAAAPIEHKRRVHFHAFMGEVHARIHAWRERKLRHAAVGDDPIAPVAETVAAEARLLCFDEFAVTDITDAMILGRLFARLFDHGVTVVATSNVEPSNLYRDGLNRTLFLPFIALLEQHMAVVRLEARTDFRLLKLAQSNIWLVPVDAASTLALDRTFASLTGERTGQPTSLPLLGRSVAVPAAAGGVARFPFAGALRRAARRRRFPGHRPRLPHRPDRRHPRHRGGRAQRRQAVHHPGRHLLRSQCEARRFGRCRTGRSLPGR